MESDRVDNDTNSNSVDMDNVDQDGTDGDEVKANETNMLDPTDNSILPPEAQERHCPNIPNPSNQNNGILRFHLASDLKTYVESAYVAVKDLYITSWKQPAPTLTFS